MVSSLAAVVLAADLDVAQNIFFAALAVAAVVGAIRVVTTDNVVHAALWLVVVLAAVGANFLLVGAEFVGVTQILVYVGAIVVLFLFGTMLTRAPIGKDPELSNRTWYLGLVVAIPLLGLLSYVLIDAFEDTQVPKETVQTTAEVSDSLFGQYLLPFEAVGLLLTATLIGAIVLARKE
jgi:NADH-quinone oxidoreductase subunit J